MEKRIKRDKKKPGVCIELEKSEMIYDIIMLIRDKAISMDDLKDFSDDLKNEVEFILTR